MLPLQRGTASKHRSLRLPTYLFPCDRSCNPTLMQWVLEPASSIHNKTAEADASYRIRLRDHPSLCLRSGIDVATTYTWYERPEPLITALMTLLIFVITLKIEHSCAHKWSRSALNRRDWERSHIFSFAGWWWLLRLALCLTATMQAYFSLSLNLPLQLGGRAFYPRQMIIHGNLLYIGCYFVHVMLTARDHKYNIRNKQKPNGTGMIAVRRVLFHCRVESFAFVLRVRPSVVAHALIIFGMRSVVAFQFGSNIVNTGNRFPFASQWCVLHSVGGHTF